MTSKSTLVINGRVYDAVTGLPVESEPVVVKTPKPKAPALSAKNVLKTAIAVKQKSSKTIAVSSPATPVKPEAKTVASRPAPNHAHRTVQKSVTLRRDIVKKPTSHATQPQPAKRTPLHVTKSPLVTKFAAHPQPLKTQKLHTTATSSTRKDVALDPIVAKTQARAKTAPVAPRRPMSHLQKSLMNERVAAVNEPARREKKLKKPRRFFARRPRVGGIVAASLAFMLLGGYLTYLSLPGLSVRVAASQAGIAASFPEYHPDGYRFHGPVSFAPGQIAIQFQSNTNSSDYTVSQQKSTWDSQAVYDNVVSKVAGNNYITNSQNGLTIYTFGNKAAWVNKGILYTIKGTATLSNEQLLRIAGSM